MRDSEEDKYWCNYIDGDLNALSALFSYHANGLITYGLKIYHDQELVKDCVQEVFIQLILNRLKLNRNDNIRGLVYKMLRNKIIDEVKKITRSKRFDNLISDSTGFFEMDAEYHHIGNEEENQRDKLLSSALSKLSFHQREALFLKYSNDFSYDQISMIMGISTSSCRTLIYRTLKQIKALTSLN
jgi:RNA polymerase sigma factor (sigma-70 family)